MQLCVEQAHVPFPYARFVNQLDLSHQTAATRLTHLDRCASHPRADRLDTTQLIDR